MSSLKKKKKKKRFNRENIIVMVNSEIEFIGFKKFTTIQLKCSNNSMQNIKIRKIEAFTIKHTLLKAVLNINHLYSFFFPLDNLK